MGRIPIHPVPRPRSLAALLVAAAAAAAVAATLTTSTGSAAARTKLSGPPVKVMTLAPVQYNGPAFKNILVVAKIAEQWINAHGGIGGRPLQIMTCDEQGDPNVLLRCGRQAIAQHVVAIVGSYSNNAAPLFPLLEKSKTAWFGICCPVTGAELSSKASFPMGNGLNVIAGQGVLAAQLPQCTKVGLLAIDIPAKPFIETLVTNALKRVGKTLVKTVTIPAVVGGDLSPQAADITTGTNCVVTMMAEANWQAFLPALKQTGTHDLFMGAQGNLDQKVVTPYADVTNGFIVCGAYPNITQNVWADYRAALKTYHADPTLDYNSLGGLGTWAGYIGFRKIAAKIKNLTNKTFFAAASKTTRLNTGGLVPVIDFAKEWTGLPGFNRLFNRSVTYQVVKNGKIVPYDEHFHDITSWLTG